MTSQNPDNENKIDVSLLEKRLDSLRDTQESVQGLSLWCQANKKHSSSIIEIWLKILKRSPVEKRLTLFYLANDIVQHARRKNDSNVVNQWALAIQKATPLVRTPSSVSTAIGRIFKIWEERSVYSKETIADLMALLNGPSQRAAPQTNRKPETYTAPSTKLTSFTPQLLGTKVKLAYRLKSHLGVTFRAKPFVHIDMDALKNSIKDRSHGMEVVQEMGQLLEQIKASEAKLEAEVEERRKIVETAEIGIVYCENVRGEARIVNSAYKNFTERIQAVEVSVDAKIGSFEEMDIESPMPSPPPSAPSPPPDEEYFLHDVSSIPLPPPPTEPPPNYYYYNANPITAIPASTPPVVANFDPMEMFTSALSHNNPNNNHNNTTNNYYNPNQFHNNNNQNNINVRGGGVGRGGNNNRRPFNNRGRFFRGRGRHNNFMH